jgi:TonB family protein
MKKLARVTTLLICSFSSLAGATGQAALQLLNTARQRANLFQDQSSPFQLDVNFIAQMRVPSQGHLTLKWGANDRWWRKIVMGDFQQIEIRSGERLYTTRNLDFTPLPILKLLGLLQFGENSNGLSVKKSKQHVENGVEITCLQVEQGNVKTKPREVCLNSASQEILREEWQEPPDERLKEQYSDYFDFGSHRYPRKLQLLLNGSVVVTASVKDLTTSVFDEALLLPPKGAIERRQCKDMKHAVAVRTPDPLYPRSASQNKLMSDTTVAMTVLTDGSVSDVRLVGSSGDSMDDATLQTLRGWKFKPATCGAEPVVSDIEVVVSFRLH